MFAELKKQSTAISANRKKTKTADCLVQNWIKLELFTIKTLCFFSDDCQLLINNQNKLGK